MAVSGDGEQADPPRCAEQSSQVLVGRVADGLRQRPAHHAYDLPGGLVATDLQDQLVAHLQIRLCRQKVGAHHQGVLVAGQEPSPCHQRRVDHLAVRGRGIDPDIGAIAAVGADAVASGATPPLHARDARNTRGDRLQLAQAIVPAEPHLEITGKVLKDIVHGALERRAHVHHSDERGAGQREGEQGQHQAALVAKRISDRQPQDGRDRRRQAFHKAIEPAPSILVAGHPVTGDRLPHGNPTAGQDGYQPGPQRHQNGKGGLEQQHRERNAEIGQVEVEQIGHEVDDVAAGPVSEGHGNGQRGQAIQGHHAQVQRDNLAGPGADRLHHPDLARLLRQQRGDGVDEQQDAEQQGDDAQRSEQGHQALVEGVLRQLAGRGDVHPRDLQPTSVQLTLDHLGHRFDVVHVVPVARHPHEQVVIGARVAEPFHRVKGHVAIGHARPGCGTMHAVVDHAGHRHLADDAGRCLDQQRVALPGVGRQAQGNTRQLRGALDQNLPLRGRVDAGTGPALWIGAKDLLALQNADPYVLVVRHGVQTHGIPGLGLGMLEHDHDLPAAFHLGHLRQAPDDLHQLIVHPQRGPRRGPHWVSRRCVDGEDRTGRVGCLIAGQHLVGNDVPHDGHRAHGEDADRD